MVIASELRAGMAIRIEGEIYKVLEAESKAGAAKLGGVVKTKLRNVTTGRAWGPHFRPQERLEDLELEQHHGIPIQRRRHLYFHESGELRTTRGSSRHRGPPREIPAIGDAATGGVLRKPTDQRGLS